jgi:hypothetical protein
MGNADKELDQKRDGKPFKEAPYTLGHLNG